MMKMRRSRHHGSGSYAVPPLPRRIEKSLEEIKKILGCPTERRGVESPKWLGLKETVPGLHEDSRVIVCYKDQEDTGIECVSYLCVAGGDYDQYEKAVWMPVTGLPWGDGTGDLCASTGPGPNDL